MCGSMMVTIFRPLAARLPSISFGVGNFPESHVKYLQNQDEDGIKWKLDSILWCLYYIFMIVVPNYYKLVWVRYSPSQQIKSINIFQTKREFKFWLGWLLDIPIFNSPQDHIRTCPYFRGRNARFHQQVMNNCDYYLILLYTRLFAISNRFPIRSVGV